MKNLTNFIAEKLHLSSSKGYLKLADINPDNNKERTVWMLYSPLYSRSKPKFYKGTYNQHNNNEFTINGPYLKGMSRICLIGDFKKGINYDDNSIIAGTKLSHGYLFIARDAEYLEKLTNKIEMMYLQLEFNSPKYDKKSKDEVDTAIKEYIEEKIL